MLVEEVEDTSLKRSSEGKSEKKNKRLSNAPEEKEVTASTRWYYFERMYQFPFAPSGLFSKLIVRLLGFTRFNTKVWDLRFSKNSIFLKKNNAHASRYRTSTLNNLSLTGKKERNIAKMTC